MRTKLFLHRVFFILPFLFVSLKMECQEWKEYSWQKTQSGVKYHILKEGSGNKMLDGDSIRLNFAWYAEVDRRMLFSTFDKKVGVQTVVAYKNAFVKGFQEALGMLKENGEGYFIIPPSEAYGDYGIQGQKTLYYYIKVVKIKHRK